MLSRGEREMQILADRLLELDYLIENENIIVNESSVPHPEVGNVAVGAETDTDTHQFVRDMMNANTVRKTNSDIKKFEKFLKENRELREIQNIPASELDGLLAKFFLSLKKKDGSEFEPQTLKSIQGSINRHLAQNGSNINIVEDREFKHSRDVLTSKRKLLRQQGKGNKENRAEPFTSDEINMLYEGNRLGIGNPRAVVQTVYLNNCLHFGMRSRIEHENLRWGDVALKCLSNGDEYLEYRERTTKTRTGLSDECRDFIPKMFADKGNPRCPVAVYKVYSSKRPEVINTAESPFYLGVKRGVNSYDETWYVNQAMGKNTIGSIVKDMCVAVGIQGRKSNHSARKTGITSLVHAGVAPTLVQQLSGHKNITSINNYSSASIQQQKGTQAKVPRMIIMRGSFHEEIM